MEDGGGGVKKSAVKKGAIAVGEQVIQVKQVIRVQKLAGLLHPALELLGGLS